MKQYARIPMESHRRGKDGNNAGNVIPAEARTIVHTAPARRPSSVIPAKAGFHTTLTEHECLYRERGRG